MTVSEQQAVKTAFFKYHVEAGARMVEFAGFMMPVQYQGITVEHLAVREKVGLFDLSHMGEFEVTGSDRLAFLQHVTTNNVAALEVGQIQYSCMTKADGGIVDDLLVYRLADRYLLVVNAANIAKDFSWLESHLDGDVKLVDRSGQVSLLASESIATAQAQGLQVGPGDFAENITTEGIELVSLAVGTRIRVGEEVLLEIAQIGKECHTGCAIFRQVGKCIMPKEGVFARVVHGGLVRSGDPIRAVDLEECC